MKTGYKPRFVELQETLPRTSRWHEALTAFLAAVQFLTRIPTPALRFTERTLPQSVLFFPLVGCALGATAGLLNRALTGHLSRPLAAAFAILFLVAITNALHEDALADCADGFGLHRSVERTLEIMHDSRIGSFGGAALVLSITLRILLVSALPLSHAMDFLIAAGTLARWSTLPLALLPPVVTRTGQGTNLAQRVPRSTLIGGTLMTVAIVSVALRVGAIIPLVAASMVTAGTAVFYKRRLGGVTGDCFGATNQLVEVVVLTCGAWVL